MSFDGSAEIVSVHLCLGQKLHILVLKLATQVVKGMSLAGHNLVTSLSTQGFPYVRTVEKIARNVAFSKLFIHLLCKTMKCIGIANLCS